LWRGDEQVDQPRSLLLTNEKEILELGFFHKSLTTLMDIPQCIVKDFLVPPLSAICNKYANRKSVVKALW